MNTELQSIAEAIGELGAGAATVSVEELDRFDADGYLLLPSLLSSEQVDRIRQRLDELYEMEGAAAGIEVRSKYGLTPEHGVTTLANLVNKGSCFDVLWTHPKLLAAAFHANGDRPFRLAALNARRVAPGAGVQALHQDMPPAVRTWSSQEHHRGCNAVWMIDEFTVSNGPTRVVPGSHRFGCGPTERMEDPSRPHPDEVQITGPAGSLALFMLDLWHSGTPNRSDRPRRGVFSAWSVREEDQMTSQRDFLTAETADRLTPAHRLILDV
jgi:hypothetical protein